MTTNSRLEDLRRRVEKDPASIAFAQLAEEYRRAGDPQRAIDVCRAGLEIHPAYLSARVTLGRALLELNQLEAAEAEMARVLRSAPENLAALRALAEIHHRRGERAEALTHYRAAFVLAPNDPELEETVADLARELEPAAAEAAPEGGLTLEEAANVLSWDLAPAAEPVVLEPPAMVQLATESPAPGAEPSDEDRDQRTVDALEAWLAAIHVARANRHP